jgi:hypothetical protein
VTRLLQTYSVRALHRRAFLRGAASAFDLRGNTMRQLRVHGTPEEYDAQAVARDWQVVGNDLRSAMSSYEGPQR